MELERTIGRVISVKNNRITIEIDRDLKSQHKTYPTGIYPVARVNSYVIVPVGSEEIVAIITSVSMAPDEPQIKQSEITLPQTRRLVYATMVGDSLLR